MSEAFSHDFNFKRYAPAPCPEPRLVWDNPVPPSRDDIARFGPQASLALAFTCVSVSIGIVRRRIAGWCDRHILKSLRSAWAIAAVGWGMTALIPFVYFF